MGENGDACLSYHEKGAACGGVPSCASSEDLKVSVLSLESLLLDLRRDVQLLSQRTMSAIGSRPSGHPQLSEETSLRWEVGSCLNVLQTMLRESLEADFAARAEAEEAKRKAHFESIAQSLAKRLSDRIKLFSPVGPTGVENNLHGCSSHGRFQHAVDQR